MAAPLSPMQGIDSNGPDGKHKIFVGGLSWTTNEDALREHFSNFGAIDEVMIMRDKATGRSRGFAFVTFKDGDSLERALQSPHHQLDGRQIEAKRAIPKAEIASKTKKIFVGGVPHTVNDEQFREFFLRFGEITEALIMRDRASNKSRGFGFVTFSNEDSVDKVFAAGQLQIQGKHVEVKKAEPKRPTTGAPASPSTTPIAVAAFQAAPGGSAAFPVFYAAPFPYAAHAFASPYAGGGQGQLTAEDSSFLLAAAASPPQAFFSFPSGTSPQTLVPGTTLVGFGNAFASGPPSAGNTASASSASVISNMQNIPRTSRVVSMAPLASVNPLLDPQQHSRSATHQSSSSSSSGSSAQPKIIQQQSLANVPGLVRTYPSPIGQPPRSPNLGPVGGSNLPPATSQPRVYPPGVGLPGVFTETDDDSYLQQPFAVRHTI
eukprot:TRINITY_DN4430_c0_g1_i1.p1 TRINITY_DN4430_c0_g1~~TRINITY_DN4430_c0_g1_i1.p1  ORF type:complete len:433 (-),score=102.57 TRINITY_DN4430_c0_g1_i1:525-1823(-)